MALVIIKITSLIYFGEVALRVKLTFVKFFMITNICFVVTCDISISIFCHILHEKQWHLKQSSSLITILINVNILFWWHMQIYSYHPLLWWTLVIIKLSSFYLFWINPYILIWATLVSNKLRHFHVFLDENEHISKFLIF